MNSDYLKQKRILLVDDEQELLDMVVSYKKTDFKILRQQKQRQKPLRFQKLINRSLQFLM